MSKFYISHFVADFETQATRSASSVFCLFDALKGETKLVRLNILKERVEGH